MLVPVSFISNLLAETRLNALHFNKIHKFNGWRFCSSNYTTVCTICTTKLQIWLILECNLENAPFLSIFISRCKPKFIGWWWTTNKTPTYNKHPNKLEHFGINYANFPTDFTNWQQHLRSSCSSFFVNDGNLRIYSLIDKNGQTFQRVIFYHKISKIRMWFEKSG